MSKNANLNKAGITKNDEFYTQLFDIENQLKHYKHHFKNKVILCNCDDPYESNFFRYFAMNFEELGLKKLISTCYSPSAVAGRLFPVDLDFHGANKAYVAIMREFTRDEMGGASWEWIKDHLNKGKNEVCELNGNGDFRSPECIEFLKEADIVVTNPPFSLIREYIAQLFEYKKNFIIIGPKSVVTYKETFPLLKDNKMWIGYPFNNGNAYFYVPNGKEEDFAKGVFDTETNIAKFRNCNWYTNLDIKKRHEDIILTRWYDDWGEEEYPFYDNYNAIEVGRLAIIPRDYEGVMGVPITIMDKLNPEQFEIIGITNHGEMAGIPFVNNCFAEVNGKRKYVRVFVKNLKCEKKIKYDF